MINSGVIKKNVYPNSDGIQVLLQTNCATSADCCHYGNQVETYLTLCRKPQTSSMAGHASAAVSQITTDMLCCEFWNLLFFSASYIDIHFTCFIDQKVNDAWFLFSNCHVQNSTTFTLIHFSISWS